MKRREFITIAGGAAAGWRLTAHAQQPTTFREGFAVLGRLGLSFDAWLYHPQLEELATLARAFSDTRIVLNHAGGPIGAGAYRGKRNEVFPRWAASIKALALHRNVFIKVGGLGQSINGFGFEKQTEPPSSEMLATTWRPSITEAAEPRSIGLSTAGRRRPLVSLTRARVPR